MTDYTRCATVLHVIRIRGVRAGAPSGANKMHECKFRTARFPSTRSVERTKGKARTEGGQDSQDWWDAASLIIGLNVANADFDESSGFECPLQYVTVTLASQLTNSPGQLASTGQEPICGGDMARINLPPCPPGPPPHFARWHCSHSDSYSNWLRPGRDCDYCDYYYRRCADDVTERGEARRDSSYTPVIFVTPLILSFQFSTRYSALQLRDTISIQRHELLSFSLFRELKHQNKIYSKLVWATEYHKATKLVIL